MVESVTVVKFRVDNRGSNGTGCFSTTCCQYSTVVRAVLCYTTKFTLLRDVFILAIMMYCIVLIIILSTVKTARESTVLDYRQLFIYLSLLFCLCSSISGLAVCIEFEYDLISWRIVYFFY